MVSLWTFQYALVVMGTQLGRIDLNDGRKLAQYMVYYTDEEDANAASFKDSPAIEQLWQESR